MARIRLGDGGYFDKSTGVKSDLEFDVKTQGFSIWEGGRLNELLLDWKSDLESEYRSYKGSSTEGFKDFLNGKKEPDAVITSVSGMLTEYLRLLDDNMIVSTRSNRPLSKATVNSRHHTINALLNKLPKNVLDFDFTSGKKEWESFKVNIIKSLINLGYDESTISGIITIFKSAVRYMAKVGDLNVHWMLSDLTFNASEKEVKLLTRDQYNFMINNYDKIRSDCETIEQKYALDYWMTALVLCPRSKDMRSFTADNIHYKGEKMYLRYDPIKTSNSSRFRIDVPVPEVLKKIFERNLDAFGRPLPKTQNFYLSPILKRIAKRYDVFHNRVAVVESKNGTVKTVQRFGWSLVTLHMGRATGITEYLEKGIPEQVVKSISGHTADSKAFRKYVNIRSEVTEEYLDKVWNLC